MAIYSCMVNKKNCWAYGESGMCHNHESCIFQSYFQFDFVEEWKDIVGYEGHYKISNTGRVLSVKGGKELPLALEEDKDGYLKARLLKDGVRKGYFIHRLVALHFVPNPNEYIIVNHKDQDPKNNCYKNLEWCTLKENLEHGDANLRRVYAIKKAVRCINTGEVFDSIQEASEWASLKGSSCIASQVAGRQLTAGKHPVTGEKLTWEYLEEENEMSRRKTKTQRELVCDINKSFNLHCSNTECKDCDYLEYRGVGMCKMAYLASLLGEELEVDSWSKAKREWKDDK